MRAIPPRLVVATIVMMAASCGDDDKAKTDTDTSSPGDTAAETQEDTTPGDDTAAPDSAEDTAGDTGPGDTSPADTTPTETVDEEVIARGQYIAHTVAVCVDCHSPRGPDGAFDEARHLSGVDCFVDAIPEDEDLGCLNTANLTNHPTGLANRSDAEIKKMFLEGVRPDGTALHPFMPYFVFGNMSEADADAVVAYLRSLPGVDHQVAPSQVPFTPPAAPAPKVDLASEVPMPVEGYPEMEAAMRGRYLAANVGICLECHTPETAPGTAEPRDWSRSFQGGRAFPAAAFGLPSPPFPEVIYSANLTPHENGLGERTVEQLVEAIKNGVDPEGNGVCPPMPAGPMGEFKNLADGDLVDLAHFIKSLPPGDLLVPNDCSIDLHPEVTRGRYLVHTVAVCVDCHSPRGPDGAFIEDQHLSGVECFIDADPTNPEFGCANTPNLTNHPTGLANRSDAEIKAMFLEGKRPDGTALHPFMPYFVLGNMSGEDADAIVAYLRTLPAVDHTVPPSQAPFTAPPAPAPRVDLATEVPMPRADYPEMEAAMRGRYLAANVGVCLECHTPETEPGADKPRDWSRSFQGGNAFPAALFGLPSPPFPELIFTANLTPHENGLGPSYTAEQIATVLKMGVDPNGDGVCPPMPSGPMGEFKNLTDQDALDIGHYLRSLPEGDNMIPNGCFIDLEP